MGRVAEVAVWWVVLTAGYVTTLGAFTGPEFAVAIGVALLCAVLAVVARRAARARWTVHPSWLAWIVPLLGAIAADTVRLLSRLPRGGTIRDVPAPGSAFRRAWGTVVLSSSPGSVVLDWPPEGPLTLHELGSGPPHLEHKVTRASGPQS